MPDVDIVITIPGDKVEEFRVHFLLAAPKGDFEGTDLEWVTFFLKARCIYLYRKGKKLAQKINYQDVIPLEEGT